MVKLLAVSILLICSSVYFAHAKCILSNSIVQEIKSYQSIVTNIITTVVNGNYKGKLFSDTATFVDTFGARNVGSEALDNGIDYILNWMTAQGFDNVHSEEISTPYWIRGEEKLEMLEPRYQLLSVLGYSKSVATPGPIEAAVVVVKDFDELITRSAEVPGKIVVYDHTYVNYEVSSTYRYKGAVEAAKAGAVAALVAAISDTETPLPHTGPLRYDTNIPQIPMASISKDSAQMLGRMARRGNTIKLRLNMNGQLPGNTTSRNIFGELSGSGLPNEVVMVTGQIDGQDVGQGAHDNGGSVVMNVLAISLLKSLGLRPKRTIQMVGWTAEEEGNIGVQAYTQLHKTDILSKKIAAIFESDSGLFTPLGYSFFGSDGAALIVKQMLTLFTAVNFTKFIRNPRAEPTLAYFSDDNVPSFNFLLNQEKYLKYLHSEADTMSSMNSNELDLCLAMYTASVYVIADLSINLNFVPASITTPVSLLQELLLPITALVECLVDGIIG
ncbi:hypothetical protein HA402_014663 [Bradysia odoriphaga]|nr:hypothetical protein HA402_014663 [Bradysia odoriphaga]